jgi:hypothetical protein
VFKPFGDDSSGDALVPALRCETIVDLLHRDAVGHGAHERAEVAADAFVLVDARDARERREVWAVCAWTIEVELGDGRRGDALRCFGGDALRRALRVRLRERTIEVNALVRAVPACGVAEFAADAFLFVNVRDDFVVEVEVLPISDILK